MRTIVPMFVAAVVINVGLNFSVEAQPTQHTLIPDCGGVYDLCGYWDKQSKKLVIPRNFEIAYPFHEALAVVRINGRYGFINPKGKIVIEPRFDLASSFFQGLAEVVVDNRSGVINRSGKTVVSPRFVRSVVFTKDVLLVRTGKGRPNSIRSREKLETIAQSILLGISGHGWGLFHIRTGWLTKPDAFKIRIFENEGRGLIWATTSNDQKGPYGLLRADGTWQVEPQFSHVQSLSEDRAIVRVPDGSGGVLHGAVDQDGKLVVSLRPQWLSYWVNGFGLTREGNKRGLVDRSGNLIGGRWFDAVERAETGDVGKVLVDGAWLGLDRSGKIVANPDNGKVIASCPSGLKLVLQNGKIQVLGPDGQQSVPYLLDYTYNRLACDRPSRVRLGGRQKNEAGAPKGKLGFIDLNGRLLFDPPVFDNLYQFDQGYAPVSRYGRWGIIDTKGNYTVQPKYEALITRKNNLYKVKLSGREFWISATGQEQPAPSHALSKEQRAGILACGSGARIIAKGTSTENRHAWGIVDKNGRELVKPQYRAIQCFRQGVAWAPIDAQRKWCPIDPDGSVRTHPSCVEARYPYRWSHSFPEKFVEDRYENSVLWTRAFLDFGAGKRAQPPRMLSK